MADEASREEAVFYAACEIADPDARRAFLDQACGADQELRIAVEQLLSLHDTSDGFLETPAMESTGIANVEQPDLMLGRYRLIERLGEGGFGVVWRAVQVEPVRREVAIKIAKPGLDANHIIRRFEVELQTLAMMRHPNIAMVLDAGMIGEPAAATTPDAPSNSDSHACTLPALARPYFVMELVDGQTLDAHCAVHRLSLRERLKLFLPICRAVHHAHQKGIVHRDLKPSNVLVVIDDGIPIPKVIDFGIAAAVQSRECVSTNTRHGERDHNTTRTLGFGTLEFMSPEQLERDGQVDTRTDIYTLGVILYQLLTGTTPFGRYCLANHKANDVVGAIRTADLEPPSQRVARLRVENPEKIPDGIVARSLRPELDWIVERALARSPQDRYATVNDLACDVERFMAREAVSAAPPSCLYRVKTFVRRHRAIAVASVLALAAVLAGASAATIGLIRAEKGRQLANTNWRIAEAERRRSDKLRLDAEHQKSIAITETRKAKEVVKVLEQLIGSTHRDAAHPADYTLREMLDDFSAEFNEGFSLEPDVEATLRRAVGRSYLSIGHPKSARAHLQRALELREAHLPADALALAQSRVDYAHYLVRMRQLEETERLLRLAEPVLRRHSPSPELFWAIYLKSRIQRIRNENVASSVGELTALAEAAFDSQHPMRPLTMAYVASLRPRARFAKAAVRQALEDLSLNKRATPADLALARRFAAQVLCRNDAADEAVELAQLSLAVNREIFGDLSSNTFTSASTLITALTRAGRNDDAREMVRQLAEWADRAEDIADSDRVDALMNYAQQIERQDANAAATLYLRAIEIAQAGQCPPSDLVQAWLAHGRALARESRFTDAARCFQEGARIASIESAPPSVKANLLFMQAEALSFAPLNDDNSLESQCDLLRQAVSLHRSFSPSVVIARVELVRFLVRNGKSDEANQWIAKWRQDPHRDSELARLACDVGQAVILEAQGKIAEAEQRFQDALSRMPVRAKNPLRIVTSVFLSETFIAQEKFEEAEALLLSAFHRNTLRSLPLFEALVRSRLARLYRAWDKPDVAAKWDVIPSPPSSNQ